MPKNVCTRRKLRAPSRLTSGDISPFQRFLKMCASAADCIWQRAVSIPDLLAGIGRNLLAFRYSACTQKWYNCTQYGYTYRNALEYPLQRKPKVDPRPSL